MSWEESRFDLVVFFLIAGCHFRRTIQNSHMPLLAVSISGSVHGRIFHSDDFDVCLSSFLAPIVISRLFIVIISLMGSFFVFLSCLVTIWFSGLLSKILQGYRCLLKLSYIFFWKSLLQV